MVKLYPAILSVIAGIWMVNAAPAADQKGLCSNVGDTVTIRGRADALINGGTYFVPLEQVCVHYPKSTDRFIPQNLTTMVSKLPPNIYVEVTGELRDPYPIYGIGIRPITVRNIDLEVKSTLADAKRNCEQWQKENSGTLSERAHGGRVVQSPQNEHSDDYTHRCSIWTVDTALPHELITLRRPAP
jgi:hypothetical protein